MGCKREIKGERRNQTMKRGNRLVMKSFCKRSTANPTTRRGLRRSAVLRHAEGAFTAGSSFIGAPTLRTFQIKPSKESQKKVFLKKLLIAEEYFRYCKVTLRHIIYKY